MAQHSLRPASLIYLIWRVPTRTRARTSTHLLLARARSPAQGHLEAARGGARLPGGPARRRPQDGGRRAPVLLRAAGHPRRHARVPGGLAARPVPARGVVRRGARRAAAHHRRPAGGVRAAREPDPPRAAHVHGAQPALPRVPAPADVPVRPRGREEGVTRVGVTGTGTRERVAEVALVGVAAVW